MAKYNNLQLIRATQTTSMQTNSQIFHHIPHLLISIAAFLSHPTIDYIVTHGEEFPLHFKDLSAYVQT